MGLNMSFNLIDFIFLIAPLFYGVMPVWSCCLLGIVCTLGIINKYRKEKSILIPKGPTIYLLIIYIFSFLITEFVAIDKGMNLLAFIKNIPIILFVILLAQFNEKSEEKNRHLYMTSISASVSVIISLLLSSVTFLNIYSGNRLHGLFYYANSYGLFLLIGVLVLFFRKNKKWYDYLMLVILFSGIVLTNSRAIILMTFLFLIISIFFNKKQWKSSTFSILGFVVIFATAYFGFGMEKRINSEMLESSEFISRIIYYEDALSLIKNHPLGLGYEGFWYEQAKEQTGIYDSKFVHSSILQIGLDVGIIPMFLISALFIITFFNKKQSAFSRIIMLAIVGHSIIDVDLEYLYFILIFSMFMDYQTVKLKSSKIVYGTVIPMSFIMVWIFLGDAFFYAKNFRVATSIIPFHSDALQEMLYTVTTENEQLNYANKTLKYNKNVSGAYEALRNEALKNNDFNEAIKNEKQRLLLNKYKIQNYIQYAGVLVEAAKYYSNKNDNENTYKCLEEIVKIEDDIKNVLDETNPLCYKTIHTPELDIPEKLQSLIEESKEIIES